MTRLSINDIKEIKTRGEKAVMLTAYDFPSARIADPSTLPQWVTSVGLDEGATLPIHVFVRRRLAPGIDPVEHSPRRPDRVAGRSARAS